jgi:hypothetical protein
MFNKGLAVSKECALNVITIWSSAVLEFEPTQRTTIVQEPLDRKITNCPLN